MARDAPPPLTTSGRAPETEEVTNRFAIHPLARRVTPVLARLGVAPNAVSLFGMACGIGAGVAYAGAADRRFALLGFGLMVLWHLADGIDGQLARLTHTHSAFGRVLDGICDYVTFTAVYVAFASMGGRADGSGAVPWLLAAAAGASHAVQAASYEAAREAYDTFGRGLGSALNAEPAPRGATLRRGETSFERLGGLYTAIQRVATRGHRGSARQLGRLIEAHRPVDRVAIRAEYRAAFAPIVRRWSVLSANTHTIAIAAFAFAGAPLGYFVFELTVLNLLLFGLLAGQRRETARFADALTRRPVAAGAGGAPGRPTRVAAVAP